MNPFLYIAGVSELHIKLPESPIGQTDQIQNISVTHISTRTVSLKDRDVSLGICPGLMLLIPQNRTVQLFINSESFDIYPNNCLIVDGNSKKRIAPPRSAEVEGLQEKDEGLVHIIEVSALINNAFGLHEQIETPLALNSDISSRIDTLYRQLALGYGAVSLTPGSPDISNHIGSALLITTLLEAAAQKTDKLAGSAKDTRLTSLKEFLAANLMNSISTPDMAAHIGMSRSAFCQWAPQALGTTPARYLRRLRLEKSQELLAQDSAPVDQIAELTGFSDRAHLSREFKTHFGITPVQCRRLARRPAEANCLQKIANAMSRNQYKAALTACEEALRNSTSTSIREKIQFDKANCLRALGHTAQAMAEWKSLHGGIYGHQADIERCRLFFAAAEYENSIKLLRALYIQANETQKNDIINLWMDQAITLGELRRATALRSYLSLRKELFADNERSIHTTLALLHGLGEENEVPNHCARMTGECFNAVRRTGRLQEAFERYGKSTPPLHAAVTLYLFGHFDEMLEKYPDVNPSFAAKALTALGRAEEAIKRYPDHSACAYLSLKRFEELLARFPAPGTRIAEGIYALHALGRRQELKNYPRRDEWLWTEAQLYSNPAAILQDKGPASNSQKHLARLLLAIEALKLGNKSKAMDLMDQIEGVGSADFWWADHFADEILMTSLTRGMAADRKQLTSDLKEIESKHKFKDKQALWHDASYLAGNISQKTYLAQPQQSRIARRFDFIDCVARDLEGKTEHAASGYRKFLKENLPYGADELLRHRFAEWRLNIIS